MLKKTSIILTMLFGTIIYGNEKHLKIEMAERINEFIVLKVVPDESADLKKYLSQKLERKYHIVKKGESLGKIAKEYNTTIKKLKLMNKLNNQDLIIVGEKLIVEEDYE